ncbi:hypothetical protein HDV57DRAFT_501001 [Trichoderma longibrachiatum]
MATGLVYFLIGTSLSSESLSASQCLVPCAWDSSHRCLAHRASCLCVVLRSSYPLPYYSIHVWKYGTWTRERDIWRLFRCLSMPVLGNCWQILCISFSKHVRETTELQFPVWRCSQHWRRLMSQDWELEAFTCLADV